MTVRRMALISGALAAAGAFPAVALAHPLGNFTVNRAVDVTVSSQIDVRYIVDMAEIPAFETIQDIDVNRDGRTDEGEVATYGDQACNDVREALLVTLDGQPAQLASQPGQAASTTFPPGAGGLETLRLECHFEPIAIGATPSEHLLTVEDTTDDGRLGWREMVVTAAGGAALLTSDVPADSPSGYLTRYPQESLSSTSNVRSAHVTFTPGTTGADAGPPGGPSIRDTANDPLASLIAGELSPMAVLLAFGLAIGLGVIHALSPGHGKMLVAAYVVGAGGDARSAVQIGLFVAVSHTGGVFALGLVTLLASEFLLPERVIAWLSLASSLIVALLGMILIVRGLRRSRTSDTSWHDHAHHAHDHHDYQAEDGGRAHAELHGHAREHGHTHAPPAAALTWRAALALGFAGGSVPSASAVIVLLVAISSDRLIFGSLLIIAFGIGMAIILGGLGLVVARVGAAAATTRSSWFRHPLARAIGRQVPVLAGIVVLTTGVFFAFIAARQLG